MIDLNDPLTVHPFDAIWTNHAASCLWNISDFLIGSPSFLSFILLVTYRPAAR